MLPASGGVQHGGAGGCAERRVSVYVVAKRPVDDNQIELRRLRFIRLQIQNIDRPSTGLRVRPEARLFDRENARRYGAIGWSGRFNARRTSSIVDSTHTNSESAAVMGAAAGALEFVRL